MNLITQHNDHKTDLETSEVVENFTLLDVLSALWQWRRMILIMTIVTTLGSVVISLLLPNYYTASVIIMPANDEKSLFGDDGKNDGLYGGEDAIDRMLIFANSTALVRTMIDQFNLAERYKINNDNPKGEARVAKRFLKLYNIKKNEYSGIEITMQDTDPLMAATMLNTALSNLDSLYRAATSPNKHLILATYENALAEKRAELFAISDSLARLRKYYNIFDVETQGEYLSQLLLATQAAISDNNARLEVYTRKRRFDSIQVISARLSGLENKLAILTSQDDSMATAINIDRYNKGKEVILYFEDQVASLNDDINDISTEYGQFKAQAQSQASAVIELEPVQVPKIKSSPSRTIIVLGTAFLSLLVGLMIALVLDLNKRVDWNAILNKK